MEHKSQLAVKVAVEVLKERCRQFQERIGNLEKENVILRTRGDRFVERKQNGQELEVEDLRRRIIELTEQKSHLKKNVSIVTDENRRLWSKLTELVCASGGSDNVVECGKKQATSARNALIRSKTFTQEQPAVVIRERAEDIHDKISLELEDISLKLIDSIAKEKTELELQCSQMAQLQAADLSFAFSFDNFDDDGLIDHFECHLNDLKSIRDTLNVEKKILLNNMENLKQRIKHL